MNAGVIMVVPVPMIVPMIVAVVRMEMLVVEELRHGWSSPSRQPSRSRVNVRRSWRRCAPSRQNSKKTGDTR